VYKKDYDFFISSGLYQTLVDKGRLIEHKEVELDTKIATRHKVIKPKLVPFISYPYEWCFSQLKDAALLTLDIQKIALEHGMSLKDASAYNVQFVEGRPVFIDTLSFEILDQSKPWVAYKQFCQHFLAPLALVAFKDIRLNLMSRTHIDGVPLDLASKILPNSSRLNTGILIHIHIHAQSQVKYSDSKAQDKERASRNMSKSALRGLLESLISTVRGLKWKPIGTEWAEYYQDNSYTTPAIEDKQNAVSRFIDAAKPKVVWDLGANTGLYSRIASGKGIYTISSDVDPAAVEINYRQVKANSEKSLMPIVQDLTNPSPSIGWANEERDSFLERKSADIVLALALVHHIAISNNVPLEEVAKTFAKLGKHLIIEFVPKSDKKVKKLLLTRKDIFPEYTQAGFEKAFSNSFEIKKTYNIKGSKRVLYLMRTK
jgi:hypothetical protein